MVFTQPSKKPAGRPRCKRGETLKDWIHAKAHEECVSHYILTHRQCDELHFAFLAGMDGWFYARRVLYES